MWWRYVDWSSIRTCKCFHDPCDVFKCSTVAQTVFLRCFHHFKKCLGYSVRLHGQKKNYQRPEECVTTSDSNRMLMTCQDPGVGWTQGTLRGQCQVPGSFMQQFNRTMACWLLTFNAVGVGGGAVRSRYFLCDNIIWRRHEKILKHPFDVHRWNHRFMPWLIWMIARIVASPKTPPPSRRKSRESRKERVHCSQFIVHSLLHITSGQGHLHEMIWNALNCLNLAETQGCWSFEGCWERLFGAVKRWHSTEYGL